MWIQNKQLEIAKAIKAGMDMVMVPEDWKALLLNTVAQVESGVISEGRIDEAVRRILTAKMKAGLFDAPMPSAKAVPLQANLGSEEQRPLA